MLWRTLAKCGLAQVFGMVQGVPWPRKRITAQFCCRGSRSAYRKLRAIRIAPIKRSCSRASTSQRSRTASMTRTTITSTRARYSRRLPTIRERAQSWRGAAPAMRFRANTTTLPQSANTRPAMWRQKTLSCLYFRSDSFTRLPRKTRGLLRVRAQLPYPFCSDGASPVGNRQHHD